MEEADIEARISKYLLGDVPDYERTWLEDRFEDEGFFERCQRREDDLIDDYVLGHLSTHERELFETNFLSSARRREKLKTAQLLIECASQMPAVAPAMTGVSIMAWLRGGLLAFRRVRGLAAATAVIALLMAASAGVVLIKAKRQARESQAELEKRVQLETNLERQLDEEQRKLADQRDQFDHLAQDLARERALLAETEEQLAMMSTAQAGSVAFTLFPGGDLRSSAGTRYLTLLSGARSITLRLVVESSVEHKSFRVLLKTADLELILEAPARPEIRHGGHFIVTHMKTTTFSQDEYVLILEGKPVGGDFEPVETYRFRIKK